MILEISHIKHSLDCQMTYLDSKKVMLNKAKWIQWGNKNERYKPISNIDLGKLSEEPNGIGGFYPLSYYDLSAFNKNEHIKCGDKLFDYQIHYDDIAQIFLVMKGAGNSYDNQTFEVQTSYPIEMINFMQHYSNEIHKQAQRALDIGSFLESSFNDLKNITIHIQVQNQNISFLCNKLIKLVDKGLIKDEESLLEQNKILNQEKNLDSMNTSQSKESQHRIRKHK